MCHQNLLRHTHTQVSIHLAHLFIFFLIGPRQEGLVLLDGVQFVGGGVATLAGQLLFGVVGTAAARDVDVTATQVTAAFQGQTRTRT